MGRLDGKVALITGAGGGVGRACMQLFAEEGARVTGVGRTRASLDASLAAATAAGGMGTVHVADLSEEGAAERAVKATLDAHGALDIVVHTAAIGYSWQARSPGTMGPLHDTGLAQWREVMAINLDAAFLVAKAALGPMRAQKRGSIVFVGSSAAHGGVPDAHAYAVSKAGVHNLVKQMAITYVDDGVRTNCVSSGPIDTEMTAEALRGLFADPATSKALSPMARVASPREIALACLHLASDEASYTNGAILPVDGGLVARL